MSDVYNSAEQVAADIEARVLAIRTASGAETNIGASVFMGKIHVGDDEVPCASVLEGGDQVLSTPGRASVWQVEQEYALVGYAACDPARPNDAAHAMIRDFKRAIFFTDGKPDTTLGGKVRAVHYRGRKIGPRADGQAIVMALVEVAVEYVDKLA